MNNKSEHKIDIRIFGASDCHHCSQLKIEFENLGIPYDFIDANADETQDMCDENNVDILPHAQAMRGGKIIYEKSGPFSASHFLADISKKLSYGKQDFPDIKKPKEGCKECGKKN